MSRGFLWAAMIGLFFMARLSGLEGDPFSIQMEVSTVPVVGSLSSKEFKVNLYGQCVVSLSLRYPSTYQPDYERLLKHLLKGGGEGNVSCFSLIKQGGSGPVTKEGETTESLVFFLEPWCLGRLPVAFYEVRFIPKNKAVGEPEVYLWSEMKFVTVQASELPRLVLAPTLIPLPGMMILGLDKETEQQFQATVFNEEKEAKRDRELFQSHRGIWLFVLAGLGMGGVSWWGWKGWSLWRRRRSRVMPSESVMDRLQELEKHSWPAEGAFVPFYVSLTGLMRRYLSDQYGLKESEDTEEFLQRLADAGVLSNNRVEKVRDLFRRADLIKFAGASGSAKECIEDMVTAREFATDPIQRPSR